MMPIRKRDSARDGSSRPEESDNLPDSPQYLIVGEILRPHGVRGEMRMRIITDFPERLGNLEWLYFGPDHIRKRLLRVRRHREAILIQIEGVTDRDAVERFRNMLVYVAMADAVPLAEGEHYLFEMLGLQVVTDDDRPLGTIVAVIETGANDVYVVEGPDGEVLLPAIPEVVLEVDVPGRRMLVHLLDGLL